MTLPGGGATGQIMGYAGGFTALVAVLIALSQKDCKRLLAYHSISQIGYVVAAWGAGISASAAGDHASVLAFGTAAFLHACTMPCSKACSSCRSAPPAMPQAYGMCMLRNANKALRLGRRTLSLYPGVLCVGAMAITALPPFNGYASKAALSYVLKGRWEYLLLFAAGIGTMASFIKLSRIFWPTQARHPRGPAPDFKTGYRITRIVIVAQALLSSLCIATGLFAPAFSAFARTLISGMPSTPCLQHCMTLRPGKIRQS
jgi:formate hydrogenlyase subunit 3/multisubunit Na+/H+ antiporter MnhD subunit